ncbi:hydrogenase maturation protease [Thermodesulfovibrio sp.]|jgi:hydrogenase maturation protease|uniref:hydrogenase maturation protease n=1 Tax=Thermodesulfovibrio TaxID=28261 RepID=UPI002603AD7F|nr:hydrogenase maturation protease [Thermodesulfovibrio sp.]
MKSVIIGIGNPNFKDDGVGLKIVEHFEGVVDTVTLLNIGFNLIDSLLGYEKALIVDGVKTGAEPGSIIEFDVNFWGNVYASGTHNFSIFEIIRIGYSVFPEEMPKEIKIIGVEVEDVETLSRECSPSVESAIPLAISKIKNYLGLQ